MTDQSTIKRPFSLASYDSLPERVGALKKIIDAGQFTEASARGEIDLKALISLSYQADDKAQKGKKPTFDFVASKDPLTLRVANRLHKPLKEMGFKPVFIFGTYKKPDKFIHPQLQEFALQTEILNHVVIPELDRSLSGAHFLTPARLRSEPTVSKVLDDTDSINDPKIIDYVGSPKNNVSITNLFRLYERVGDPFIGSYRDEEGKWGKLKQQTTFRVNADDDGMRSSLITNIHPSQTDHGVIPPFWPQLRMLELMDELDIDWSKKTPEEVAEICIEHNVNPYPTGMIHHVVSKFDQGDVILQGKAYQPIDLNKSVWENYFEMEEFIVDSILATAAAYKLDLPLKGTPQNLNNAEYHSYPGEDSRPPMYFPPEERAAIKKRDANALKRFEELGGKLCDREHFTKLILGDPDTGMLGFVLEGTPTAYRLKQRIDEAYTYAKIGAKNHAMQEDGKTSTVAPQASATPPSPYTAANDEIGHGDEVNHNFNPH